MSVVVIVVDYASDNGCFRIIIQLTLHLKRVNKENFGRKISMETIWPVIIDKIFKIIGGKI